MIVQYCSDLHLEFEANYQFLKRNPLPVVGDVLVLAGDVTTFSKMDDCRDFLDYLSYNFKMIYWVPGNHEYYHSDVDKRSGYLRENIRSNLLLVNNCVIIQDGTRFVFSTLWSAIRQLHENRIRNSMSDFRLIKSKGACLSVNAYNRLHEESVKFLGDELSRSWSGDTIVVSHHVPTFKNYPPEYADSILNEAFATELSGLIRDTAPSFWIYGHHHGYAPPFTIGKTKLLNNQVGYVHMDEHKFYKAGSCFEVASTPPDGS